MKIVFLSDSVNIKTGRVDNSATVTFIVGEYQLKNIKELVGLLDVSLKVTVEIDTTE